VKHSLVHGVVQHLFQALSLLKRNTELNARTEHQGLVGIVSGWQVIMHWSMRIRQESWGVGSIFARSHTCRQFHPYNGFWPMLSLKDYQNYLKIQQQVKLLEPSLMLVSRKPVNEDAQEYS
jgi:hypothetical protein